ncbi:MAG: M42 family peptidase [Kiritimatiellae bacterium]|nr:M42 family peptidase [Kiritimatiellia bacterium]
MQPDFELLKALVSMPTPTGFEYDGMMLLAKSLRDEVKDLAIDRHGNLRARVNAGAPVKVMLEGHCDEIGFIVHYIDDDGFLYVSALGGVTVPLVAAERILIKGINGPVNGVFGVRPPHLMNAEERKKVAPTELKSIKVDIGATSREDAMKLVELGAPAVVDTGWRPLANNRISCRGFDNRIGAFVVTQVMKRLAREKLNVDFNVVASVQEEIGLVGGHTTAFDINPDIGLCVDVGFASDAQKDDRTVIGDIRLGGGPIIGIGPTYHPVVRKLLEQTADDNQIVWQRRAAGRGTGTCAWAMRMERGGAAVAQISIPLRYMHSPVEVISLDDAAATIELLTAAIKAIPADINLCPPQP